MDLPVADQHVAPGKIHGEIAHDEGRGRGAFAKLVAAPEGRPHAGEQLADGEGLADIVVGAAVEGGDLVALLPSRGEHDDGHRGPLAKPREDTEAVEVGQAQVENDEVWLAGRRLDQTVLAVARLEEAVAMARERGAEEAPDLWLVLDEDHRGPGNLIGRGLGLSLGISHPPPPHAGGCLRAGA